MLIGRASQRARELIVMPLRRPGGVLLGLTGMGAITGGLVPWVHPGNNSGSAGPRVPFAAGVHKVLPPAFARLHPRYHTPVTAIVVQGIVATAIFLASVFVTVTGGSTTIQEAYDIMVNLTILVYFVPYLYLFPAMVRLRRLAGSADEQTVIRVQAEHKGCGSGDVGFLATATSSRCLRAAPNRQRAQTGQSERQAAWSSAWRGALLWSTRRFPHRPTPHTPPPPYPPPLPYPPTALDTA